MDESQRPTPRPKSETPSDAWDNGCCVPDISLRVHASLPPSPSLRSFDFAIQTLQIFSSPTKSRCRHYKYFVVPLQCLCRPAFHVPSCPTPMCREHPTLTWGYVQTCTRREKRCPQYRVFAYFRVSSGL
jgi:hypothetical protein